jgi:predicted PurR-regulated permease PerM
MGTATTIVVFIVALLISVGFLLLVLTLVPAINQLRLLMADLAKTSEEARDLTVKLQGVVERVDNEAEKVGEIIESSKKSLHVISKTLSLVNRNVLRKSAGVMALIPAIRFGWNMVRKTKGGRS